MTDIKRRYLRSGEGKIKKEGEDEILRDEKSGKNTEELMLTGKGKEAREGWEN